MMFKKIRKYLIILMAVAIVASFSVIQMGACPYLEHGHGEDWAPCGGTDYLYWAWGYAYCPYSPYYTNLYTPVGNSYDSGDPGGWDNDTAQSSVSYGCDTAYEASSIHYYESTNEGCHCQ